MVLCAEPTQYLAGGHVLSNTMESATWGVARTPNALMLNVV